MQNARLCNNMGVYKLPGQIQKKKHSYFTWARDKMMSSSCITLHPHFLITHLSLLVVADTCYSSAYHCGICEKSKFHDSIENQQKETTPPQLEKTLENILFNTTLYVRHKDTEMLSNFFKDTQLNRYSPRIRT